jgi:ribosomal protein L15
MTDQMFVSGGGRKVKKQCKIYCQGMGSEGGRGGEGAHQISSQTRPKKKAEAQPHTKLPTHFIEDLEKTPRNFSREFIIFPVKNGGERPEAIQRNTKATVLPCLQRNLKHPLNQLS